MGDKKFFSRVNYIIVKSNTVYTVTLFLGDVGITGLPGRTLYIYL